MSQHHERHRKHNQEKRKMMLGCPLFFYSSMKSLHPLLHRLRLKRRLINTGNKFLLANFPNKVTGRPSSLLYDHLVLCMSISSLHPSLSNSLFPQPMLTALPVTHLVDSGSISLIVYIYCPQSFSGGGLYLKVKWFLWSVCDGLLWDMYAGYYDSA